MALNAYVRWAHDRVADPLGSLVARTARPPTVTALGLMPVRATSEPSGSATRSCAQRT